MQLSLAEWCSVSAVGMLLNPQLVAALAEVLAPELRGSPALRQQLAVRLRLAAAALDSTDQSQQKAPGEDKSVLPSSAGGAAELSYAAPPLNTQEDVRGPKGPECHSTKAMRRTKCKAWAKAAQEHI